ncbi:hypothetical protein FKM82_022850 [Ascaphus truei]
MIRGEPTRGLAMGGQKLMATACCRVAIAEGTWTWGWGQEAYMPPPSCWSSACCTISRSYLTISWMISFSWLLKTPEFRSCWTLCIRIEFFFPVG